MSDLIERQAMLDGLEKYHDGADLHIDGLTYAYDLVCKLPSVSTEKTGRWKFDERIDKHYYCSECKAMGVDYFDYCPYCGRRLKDGKKV